ncbi:hypothetical protein DD238_005048 [Peronospora effusa]|uniref:t-SNARE coiled-coil homology domain-containing protein n=1 Tax=Peronospora effusa TaxID=542832 RepID=A0A3M6VIW1_9STRA|nr:hypothetical protein DD238_005048 [Peronospora effusa]
MSFADFASTSPTSSSTLSLNQTKKSTSNIPNSLSLPSRQAIETATLKLEQFQRQVVAIKRSSSVLNAIDEDLHDRIRFACLLQEEIATLLTQIPPDAVTSLLKRKIWKDFQTIATQFETLVVHVSAREQEQHHHRLQEHQDGYIRAPQDGQQYEFTHLEHEIAQNEVLIQEREDDIVKIHQSVAQVNEIFRDLAAIVHDQQGDLDVIETHVEKSREETQKGLEEVKKASEMQGFCVVQ